MLSLLGTRMRKRLLITKRDRCEEKIELKYGCGDQYGVRQLTDVVQGQSFLITRQRSAILSKTGLWKVLTKRDAHQK